MNVIRERWAWKWRWSHNLRNVCLALAWGVAAHSADVLAQSAPRTQAPADYQQLIDRGLAAYGEQRPAEARSLFAQAHALQPGARTLRALGIADLALDNYTMAREELEAALTERVLPLTESQRTEVRELLRWMEHNLGALHLSFTPLHAEAKIDGRAVNVPDVLLAPEQHKLTISARGFLPQERTFTLSIDRPIRLEISLDPAPTPVAPIADAKTPSDTVPVHMQLAEQQPSPHTPDTGPKLWPWLGGASAALLVAGGTMFAFGLRDKATVENATSPVRLSEIEAAHDRVPWLTGVGLSLGIAGLAGLGTAAVLLLMQREPRQDVAWSMQASPTHISMTRRF